MKRWSVVAGRCRAGEIQWRDDIFLADLAYHYDKLIKENLIWRLISGARIITVMQKS